MTPTLRPYQDKIILEARKYMMAGVRSILVQSPTGSGKTLLTAKMLKTSADKGMPSWFINHRRELIRQSITTFGTVGVNHGVIANGWMEDRRQLIQIGSVQTMARRLNAQFKTPKLIIWDECHHLAAAGWAKIFEAYPNAFHIGLTATPERLDGRGLGKFFKVMINGPSVRWLIDNGYLCDYKLYAPSSVNMTGIHNRMGDFDKKETESAVDKPTITGDAIAHYKKYGTGKRAVVFCVSVEHSKRVVSQFIAAGIPAEHVDGETDLTVRDGAIRRFTNGEIKVLSNVDLFGEGFDLPSLEVAILLRPTQSLGLYLQQVGRALRPHPGKSHAIILDHAGNCERHGLPDEERFWTLIGHKGDKTKSNAGEMVKICPKCFAAQFPGRSECSFCQHVFAIQSREVEEKEGELAEVDLEAMRRERHIAQSRCETMEELIAEGKKRKYKRPEFWAKCVFNGRQARKLMRGRA